MTSDKAALRFLKLPEVMRLTALSRSSVYRRIAEGTFPPSRPYRDRTGTFWTSVEIERWQAEQVGAQAWLSLCQLPQRQDECDKVGRTIGEADVANSSSERHETDTASYPVKGLVRSTIEKAKMFETMEFHHVVNPLWKPDVFSRRKGDIYVFKVAGHSVAPKYDDGDPVYIDRGRQPLRGEYVIVQLKSDGPPIGLLKRMVRRTSAFIELHQIKPEVTFQVSMREIDAIHRVIPWRELVLD